MFWDHRPQTTVEVSVADQPCAIIEGPKELAKVRSAASPISDWRVIRVELPTKRLRGPQAANPIILRVERDSGDEGFRTPVRPGPGAAPLSDSPQATFKGCCIIF